MKNFKNYIEENKNRFINELFELLRIPSVSAKPEHDQDVRSAAELLKKHFIKLDLDNCEICETKGHPIVYGEKIISKDLPTILVYGHYDVQPVDPLNLWDQDPFNPYIKKTEIHPEGAIFARGACDDKGQMFMHLKALEVMLENGDLPCNVKFMIEGEEEVGSDNLELFVKENKEKLSNDIILVSDTGMISKTIPSITTGLRGLSYMEVELTGPNRDLHSGHYGGTVANPINVLSKMINSLHDSNNKITIPGFYDNVMEVSEEDRKEMNLTPFNIDEFKDSIGLKAEHGEAGYSTIERQSIRPALDVNGIWGGYIEEGAKTVLPSKAFAKISMRLVPGQNWKRINELFTKHIKNITPKTVSVKVREHHGGQPYVAPTDTIGFEAASKAYEDVFNKKPIATRDGGSIPIIALFEQELESKTILMGFGLDSDAIHSPNEHYGVSNFLQGIETISKFYYHFTNLSKD
ncbi:dipeptidase [Flavobacteriaceae bacterium]|nr:dipeptidase [Flavobacteriaceae bacterium]MDB4239972.1 dipeptidase [Flavobacteriaceae bacterium]MDB9787639.1 dipeptidase [Flavobacteriaceae bacterium]MDB9901991.1 dipeptidase [Flavobacteriaceae bacterium]MDC0958165.1 dipeptidase [Flavobacteriaceae bacterium]